MEGPLCASSRAAAGPSSSFNQSRELARAGPCVRDLIFLSREGRDLGVAFQAPPGCLEIPMDAGAWWATVHGVAKSWTQLNDFTFTFPFHALEKEMATHSSVLAWGPQAERPRFPGPLLMIIQVLKGTFPCRT